MGDTTDEKLDFPTHAGGIVFRRGKDGLQYLLVSSSRDADQWVFPKGHIEKGEEPEGTAAREVGEEAGIEARVLERVGELTFKSGTEDVRSVFYLMELLKEQDNGEPRRKHWCSYDEAMQRLTFADSRQLLRLANTVVQEPGDKREKDSGG